MGPGKPNCGADVWRIAQEALATVGVAVPGPVRFVDDEQVSYQSDGEAHIADADLFELDDTRRGSGLLEPPPVWLNVSLMTAAVDGVTIVTVRRSAGVVPDGSERYTQVVASGMPESPWRTVIERHE